MAVNNTIPIITIPTTDDQSELDTSGDSGRGKHSHQFSSSNVYMDGSLIPNKGKLLQNKNS